MYNYHPRCSGSHVITFVISTSQHMVTNLGEAAVGVAGGGALAGAVTAVSGGKRENRERDASGHLHLSIKRGKGGGLIG